MLDNGTCSSATAFTLVDNGKNWGTNALLGLMLRITSGAAVGCANRTRFAHALGMLSLESRRCACANPGVPGFAHPTDLIESALPK